MANFKLLFAGIFVFLLFSQNGFSQDIFDYIVNSDSENVKKLLNEGTSPNTYNFKHLAKEKYRHYNTKRLNVLQSYYAFKKNTTKDNWIAKHPEIKQHELLWEYRYQDEKAFSFKDNLGTFKILELIEEKKETSNTFSNIFLKTIKESLNKRKESILWEGGTFALAGNYTPVKIQFDTKKHLKHDDFVYPIFGAIMSKNYDLVKELISKGACLNMTQTYFCHHHIQVDENEENFYFAVAGLLYKYATYDRKSKRCTNKELFYQFCRVADNYDDVKFSYTPLTLIFAHKYADPNNPKIQEVIDLMLEKGANPNYPTTTYNSYKHIESEKFFPLNMMVNAIVNNDIENVKKLYAAGFHYKKNLYEGFTASKRKTSLFKCKSVTQLAKEFGNQEIIAFLSNPEGERNELNAKRTFEFNDDLIRLKKIPVALQSIEKGAIIVPKNMKRILASENPELIAAVHQNIKTDAFFHCVVRQKTTPFIELIKNKHFNKTKEIIENDKLNTISGNYLKICFEYAVASENNEIIDLLLAKLDKTELDRSFIPMGKVLEDKAHRDRFRSDEQYLKIYTPFLSALKFGTPELVKKLVEKGADANALYVYSLDTRLNLQLLRRNNGKLEMLNDTQIKRWRKIKNLQTTIRPLLYYCWVMENQNPEIVKILLDNGADANFQCPMTGSTSIYYARNYETIKHLCAKKANANVINLCSRTRPTALWNWIDMPSWNFPENHDLGIKALIKNGADTKVKAYDKRKKNMSRTIADKIKNSRTYEDKTRLKKTKSALKS